MLIGIVGAPNKGKSTIFSAMTSQDVEIADYAFTTIKPNLGVTHASHPCAEAELGVKCTPRNSACSGGIRMIPANVIDVAGLVPGAHLGKGRGNQFLNDLVSADVLVQVVDLSGRTDENGAPCEGCDPALEVKMIRDEMAEWLAEIVMRHKNTLLRRPDGDAAIVELLSGFKTDVEQIRKAAEKSAVILSNTNWDREMARRFALVLLSLNKPIIVAANKADQAAEGAYEALRKRLGDSVVIKCSAAIELALVKAAKAGIIDYSPGAKGFSIIKETSTEQKRALEYMNGYLKANGGTGVQEVVNTAVFGALDNIVVYPVEDETHYSDHSGNVLPDAILMKRGSTAQDLAFKVHSDIGKGMKYAVDARRKIRVQKEYELHDGDVIRIISTAK